jgi:hypothetical protein
MSCNGFNNNVGRRHENHCHKYQCNDVVPRILLHNNSHFKFVYVFSFRRAVVLKDSVFFNVQHSSK